MPNGKRAPRARARRKTERPSPAPCVEWFAREVLSRLRPRRPRGRSARHLRNAAVEVLEAMRALIDETIGWLREERSEPELKRIRVEK